MRNAARAIVIVVAAVVWGSAGTASAGILWANNAGASVSSADFDGGSVDTALIGSGLTYGYFGVAADARYIYFTHDAAIGRYDTITQTSDPTWIDNVGASGLAVDEQHIYWASWWGGAIYEADIADGGNVTALVTGLYEPFQVAVDASHVYWVGNSGDIGRADLGGVNQNVDPAFIDDGGAHDIQGVAVDSSHLYWATEYSGSIVRADLDGSHPTTIVTTTQPPFGLAVDALHLYWTEPYAGTIGRSDLDGTGANESLVTGAAYPFDITVQASPIASAPSSFDFGSVQTGTETDPHRFTITNTGDLQLAISAASLAGADAASYAISGGDCATAPVPPGGSCSVDVAFTPTAAGARSAALQITDDAPDSPQTIQLSGTSVIPPPAISTISPDSGPTSGGTAVTITGTHLLGASRVTFAGVSATDVTVTSDTHLSVVTPPGSPGSAPLVVTTPAGTSSNPLAFTYVAAPPPPPPSGPTTAAPPPAPLAAPTPISGSLFLHGHGVHLRWHRPNNAATIARYILVWSTTHLPTSRTDRNHAKRLFIHTHHTRSAIRAWPGRTLYVAVYADETSGRQSPAATIAIHVPA